MKIQNIKIFNIKYLILLFLILCSLFFSVVPVLAEPTTPPAQNVSCDPSILKDEKYKGKDFEPSKILPLCVYFEGVQGYEQQCGCRNVNVLVSLLTKVANWLFGIVGAVALAVFIYGGFTILTAAGSSERVKKGKDALIAAVFGLIIVFTAQVGLKFLLKIIVTPTEKEKETKQEFKVEEKGLKIKPVE